MPSRTGRGKNAILDQFSLNFREFPTLAGLPVMQSHFAMFSLRSNQEKPWPLLNESLILKCVAFKHQLANS